MKEFDNFIKSLERLENVGHHSVVIMLMHEVTRAIYPNDPYIEFIDNEHVIDRVKKIVSNCTNIANLFCGVGSYNLDVKSNIIYDDIKDHTADVYGVAWGSNDAESMVLEAKEIIIERFAKNNIDLSVITGKKVLDLGCGSGRYSCALALLGASEVVAVDYGDPGLKKGMELADKFNLKIDFQKQDILNLNLETNSFDFVFCHGVAQHTGDIKKVTSEIFRVLRPGGKTWYYIYGSGGLFWEILEGFNKFMKRVSISERFAFDVLQIIGMPKNRHIFLDHWYVPILLLTSKKYFENVLDTFKFKNYRRAFKGRSTDADEVSELSKITKDKEMFGDAELRYYIEK